MPGWRREAGSWFQRRGEAYRKERSVIRREDDVDGRVSVTKDEERVLRGGWTDEVMQIWRLGGWENFVGKWEEIIGLFNALDSRRFWPTPTCIWQLTLDWRCRRIITTGWVFSVLFTVAKITDAKINSWFTTMHLTFYITKTLSESTTLMTLQQNATYTMLS